MSSIQGDLQKIRPPRAHPVRRSRGKCDREKGAPVRRRRLSGPVGNVQEKAKLKNRKFVEINRNNFDQILAGIRPTLKLTVPNVIQNNDSDLMFELEFTGMGDFKPLKLAEKIAEKVKPFAQTLLSCGVGSDGCS